MTYSTIHNSFTGGEISPSLFGRVDLKKWNNGASTMRNFFVNYRGGAYSRAGLAYVGTCKQSGTAAPPRDIRFQFNINQGYVLEFGDQYMRVKSDGAYVVEATKNISGATNALPLVITCNSHGYSNGDWVYITGMTGMTNLNGLTWIVQNVTTHTFTLQDLFGQQVNSTSWDAYASGGTCARLFTLVTPYAAVDLPYLKYTQSADTMSLTCVNQETGTEYAPQELRRLGFANWTITPENYDAVIAAPANVTVTAQSSTTTDTYYSYVVTAIDRDTGDESIASTPGSAQNNNIAIYAGSNTITWDMVANASSYNVYAAPSSYNVDVPLGVSYGFIGTAFGTEFVDNNIIPDYAITPPKHKDPFARGSIVAIEPTAGGTGYTQATIGYAITTSTGSGFVGSPVVVSGELVAFIVENGGAGYDPADTIAITDSGSGASATANLVLGAQTGTYPAVVAYYQQRRAYGYTLNQPDTYWMSRPGSYNNMDSSLPVSAADAIVGTPWAQQINGIQFMVPMTNALMVLTGNGAWAVNGGNSADITAANQTAQAQAYNGCSPTVPPVLIDYNVLYVQAKGSIVRDLAYDFLTNVFTGVDKTILSGHLFFGYTIKQWAYAEEPWKIVWAIRDDGQMLSLTYLKEQDVWAWARHDTNGLFVSVCSVTEPPVDAVYVITKRYVNGQWKYYSERMNDRYWDEVEDCYCVDSGLEWPMSYPNATLTPAAADGTANITSVNLISGGTGYTAPTVIAVDPTGQGTGATFSATVSGGVITAINVLAQGQDYAQGTNLVISDSTGTGAAADPIVTNRVVFTASSGVFSSGDVGDVIRVGGGKATIVQYNSPTSVTANITQPITSVIPDNPDNMPIPAASGDWSLSTPTATVTGLNHLEGMEVAILADGGVVANQIVVDGTITLQQPASSIKIGLPYVCQLQTLYLEVPAYSTMQGSRKNIYNASIRVEASRGISVGTNQTDSSTQPNNANVPWTNMKEVKERNALVSAGSAIPLYTGDYYINLPADWNTKGQLAIQQTYPLPANILAGIINYQKGDSIG